MTNNESGRSMVEMLGVLAIIGVLSIGGIAGYTQAMKKYKANEAVNEIAMAAVMCTTQGDISGLTTNYVDIVAASCVKDGDSIQWSVKNGADDTMVATMLGTNNSNHTYTLPS